ncbi:MAG: hypothetical protein LBU45_03965, partial [Azoarcus sp.]|nr:hypothetical protein [Azoarcus sp.]
ESKSTVDGKNVDTVQQGVRTYNTARKKEFFQWLYNIQPAAMNRSPFISPFAGQPSPGGTPLRRALDGAGQYYDRMDNTPLGPWANNPASPGNATTELAAQCRKSFTLLMTDGYWNLSPATNKKILDKNVDGSAPTPFKDSYSNTLADIAWYYWFNDLAPTISNRVPQTLVAGTESQNPPKVRDPATYQHMTTFTIGLGVAPNVIKKEDAFQATVTGANITWPPVAAPSGGSGSATNAIDDLLHTGVNGHGDFFAASNPDEFVNAMEAIINAVNMAQKSSGGFSTDASQSVTNVYIYKTNYMPGVWSGELTAQTHTAANGFGEVWYASEKMPTPTARKIYTHAVKFLWDELTDAQKTALKGGANGTLDGQQVLDYVRGSRANEGDQTGQFRIRHRSANNLAPLGHSPHNAPLYVESGGEKIVYLGANDGMLHAFDANTGVEKFAYIPSMLIPNLYKLTSSHDYFVDGELIATTPAQTPGKRFLTGALGRGGKGLFTLDVTSPASFSGSNAVWELSGDNCANTDPDHPKYLGNIVGSLNFAAVKGVPSIVFGNGYNSCNDKAALSIVHISDGSATFIKASDDLGNGLAAPELWKTSGNEVYAYAGDLLGRMWRFGLAPFSSASKKLFDAGVSQPVTARPLVSQSAVQGSSDVYVLFGTGRYLSISDKSALSQQSWYALIDSDGSTILHSDLKQRNFVLSGTINNAEAKSVEMAANNDMDKKKGWFINLTDPGERIVTAPLIIPTAKGDVAVIVSIIPPIGGDPCDTKGSGWLYFVDAQTGGALDEILLDLSGDGKFNESDMIRNGNSHRVPTGVKVGDWDVNGKKFGMPGQIAVVNGNLCLSGWDSDNMICREIKNPHTSVGRISWREIIK